MKLTLKAARINAGYKSQDSAGLALGISGDAVGNWERGKSLPSLNMIPIIEKIYGVKYDDIIFFTE